MVTENTDALTRKGLGLGSLSRSIDLLLFTIRSFVLSRVARNFNSDLFTQYTQKSPSVRNMSDDGFGGGGGGDDYDYEGPGYAHSRLKYQVIKYLPHTLDTTKTPLCVSV